MITIKIPRPRAVLPSDNEKIAWINANKQALRVILQVHGTDYRRSQNKNYWVDKGIAKLKALIAGKQCVAIVNDDSRFPNEIEALKQLGFSTIRVIVDDETQEKRIRGRDGDFDPAIRNHASETGLDHLRHDYHIHNLTSNVYEFHKKLDDTLNLILAK
jgi:hypothetical protein